MPVQVEFGLGYSPCPLISMVTLFNNWSVAPCRLLCHDSWLIWSQQSKSGSITPLRDSEGNRKRTVW